MTLGTISTNTSALGQIHFFKLTLHLSAGSCCLLSEARQGEVGLYAALSLGHCVRVLRSASSGILGSQTVSPVSRLVWTDSPHGARLSNKTVSPFQGLVIGPAV